MSSATQRIASSHEAISKRNFDKLSRFIYDYSGIKMPPAKQTMLEGRLRRRLRATGKDNFDAYCDFLFNGGGMENEAVYLIDAVTTNKTDFFREPNHFTYMTEKVLPSLMKSGVRTVRAWSSACSTGAEPYTMAMVMSDFAQKIDMNYVILATDLSTDVLRQAQTGIYPLEMAEPIPPVIRDRYTMRAAARDRREFRITPKLRSKVGFARLNLMDSHYPIGDPVHLIFCRNVMIYFDKETQAGVLQRLCDCLEPGGYLFIGHSESIAGFNLPLRTVANTIFQKS